MKKKLLFLLMTVLALVGASPSAFAWADVYMKYSGNSDGKKMANYDNGNYVYRTTTDPITTLDYIVFWDANVSKNYGTDGDWSVTLDGGAFGLKEGNTGVRYSGTTDNIIVNYSSSNKNFTINIIGKTKSTFFQNEKYNFM